MTHSIELPTVCITVKNIKPIEILVRFTFASERPKLISYVYSVSLDRRTFWIKSHFWVYFFLHPLLIHLVFLLLNKPKIFNLNMTHTPWQNFISIHFNSLIQFFTGLLEAFFCLIQTRCQYPYSIVFRMFLIHFYYLMQIVFS